MLLSLHKPMKLFPALLTSAILACSSQQSLLAGSPPGWVVGWGANLTGAATGDPSQTYWATGTVMIAGAALSNAVAVSAGEAFGLALMRDGRVLGWGSDSFGEATGVKSDSRYSSNGYVTVGNRELSNVVAVAAGRLHGVALKSDGTVVAWGRYNEGDATPPAGLSNVVAIAAGDSASLAVRRDGTVVGWGSVDVPLGLSNVVSVATDGWMSLALRGDSAVVQWSPGERAEGHVVASNAVAIAIGGDLLSGGNHAIATQDGTVLGWCPDMETELTNRRSEIPNRPVSVGGKTLRDVVQVAAGRGYSMALRRDGTVVAWGNMGGIDPGPFASTLRGVTAISAGNMFALAITTNLVALPAGTNAPSSGLKQ
jgi:alpha-tubulin suppressor-like RCC1 family protein